MEMRRDGAFLHILPVQVGDAVLRNDVVNISAPVVTTPAPGLSRVTIRETEPFLAVEGRAIIAFPPAHRAAPRLKSTWPPMPE